VIKIIQENFKYILVNIQDNRCEIGLNRPKRLNALNFPLLLEMIEVLENIGKNKSIRLVVIRGEGSCFSSGDDLISMGPEGYRFKPTAEGFKLPHHKVIWLIRTIKKPVIALLHSYCLGAAFELALACDIRIAADDLQMGDHRVNRAQCIMSGTSWFLPRLIGFSRASEIILSGRSLNAEEAFRIGLVSKVFLTSKFKLEATKYLSEIAKLPTKCLGYDKQMLNHSIMNDMLECLNYELKLYSKNFASHDFREGLKSFIEKRQPKYIGK
jgi:2-(1,2-epoxy-1,2-dihydrophenyl)acetyl-CoA isomerase